MKRNIWTYTVRIRSDRTFDLAGLFDMLRYDRATVETWTRDEEHYLLSLRSERFTPDRWASFGIKPTDVRMETVR